MNKLPMPAWVQAPTRRSFYSRAVRSDAFFGIFALLNLYALLVFLWGDARAPPLHLGAPPSSTHEGWNTAGVEGVSTDYLVFPLTDQFYLPVYPSSAPSPPPTWNGIPVSCLNDIISAGSSCASGWRTKQQIDFVWTWVNSSDSVWQEARATIDAGLAEKSSGGDVHHDLSKDHFRDYDELRHSVRSVLTHFRPYAHQLTILASDFALSNHRASSPTALRIGQVPQWLDSTRSPSEWRDGRVQLKVQHHANLFHPYSETSFSSFGIESQLGNLQDVNDVFVYMNDDYYLMRDLKPADFFTSSFGFVFRLEYWTQVPPTVDPEPVRGEWPALRESNVLIGQRFGPSTRPYNAHMAKVMSVSILREMSEMFPESFARTGARPMRSVWTNGEPADVHPGFMFPQFVIERWREGLLWSWTVARMAGDDDSWDADAAWTELGFGEEDVEVGNIVRDTLVDIPKQLGKSGYEAPEASKYYFSSMDGYPYYEVRTTETMEHPKLAESSQCTISRTECFPSTITSASKAFKHVAFANPQCGDCVLNRLVQNSGRRGLSAVLPTQGRTFAPAAVGPIAETLALVPDWSLGEFALADVFAQAPDLEGIDVRAWTLRMLDRYRFVLADSQYTFARLNNEENAHSQLDALQGHDKALACVNDDVGNDEDAAAVQGVFRQWQETRWGTPAAWEVV